MKPNPDKKFFKEKKQAIKDNQGYCTCMILKNEDTKCPCKQMRENQECICSLYVKE